MPADLAADLLTGNRGGHVLAGKAAIVAGQIERRLRMLTRDLGERSDQIDDVAAVEIDPTNSRRASRAPPAVVCRSGMPGGMTCTRWSGTFRCSTISRRENSEMVTMARAFAAERLLSQRRRTPSRVRYHSGCAQNDTSWMATTTGVFSASGAEYCGAKKTSRWSAFVARGSCICSHHVPPEPGTIRVTNFRASSPTVAESTGLGTYKTNSWLVLGSGLAAPSLAAPVRERRLGPLPNQAER